MRTRNQLSQCTGRHGSGIRHHELRLFSKASAAHAGILLTLTLLFPHHDRYLCRLHSADTHHLNQLEQFGPDYYIFPRPAAGPISAEMKS